jgi:hypothetical protein
MPLRCKILALVPIARRLVRHMTLADVILVLSIAAAVAVGVISY